MNRHTSTHAGQTATRNSKNRLYTHTVWTQLTAETQTARALQAVEYHTAKAAEYRAQAAAGGEDLVTATGRVIGRATVEDFIDWAESAESMAAKAQAQLDAGIVDGPWGAHSWNGRLALAQKEAARMAAIGYRTHVAEAVVA